MPSPPRRVPCVGAVVHDSHGRLLLVRRRNEPDAGRWSVPGGRVEPGESSHDAVRREVLEETSLEVHVGDLLGTVEIPAGDLSTVFVVEDYACVVVGGEPRAGDDADAVVRVDRAGLERLPLVAGLADTLASWGALPAS